MSHSIINMPSQPVFEVVVNAEGKVGELIMILHGDGQDVHSSRSIPVYARIHPDSLEEIRQIIREEIRKEREGDIQRGVSKALNYLIEEGKVPVYGGK